MSGRAWVFGDRIDTDVLAPGSLMKLTPEELSRHCLAAIRPEFARDVRPGDYVFAGDGFGIGSSREQAAVSLILLGVRAVLAKSFARIFYRNAINLGLPALFFADADRVRDGDQVDVDLTTGRIENLSQSWRRNFSPMPPHLMKVIAAGGLMALLEQDAHVQEKQQ